MIFADGSAIVASSRGASTRGMKHAGRRPGRIIIDDLENEESVATADQRDKTWDWVTRTVRPMLDPVRGRMVWVGTLLHEDAAMPRAEASGGFTVIKNSAIIKHPDRQDLWDSWEKVWDEATRAGKVGIQAADAFYAANKEQMDVGGKVLWPDRFQYLQLRKEKRRIGTFAFTTEYQNEPVPSENQIIRRDQIIDFRMEQSMENGKAVTWLLSERGEAVRLDECRLYITIDPAISEKNTADYFALGVLAVHPNGTMWLIDLVHDRMSFDKQVKMVVDVYVKWRARLGDKVIAVGIESVMYQKALKQAIDTAGRAAGLMIPTRELHPASDKILRLTRTQPAFEQGLVHVMKTEHGVVVDEVTGFTRDGKIHPKNDDAMDMLVYGVSLAESRGLTDLYGSFHL
jgi:predicted phage terminase large subunit-like protein